MKEKLAKLVDEKGEISIVRTYYGTIKPTVKFSSKDQEESTEIVGMLKNIDVGYYLSTDIKPEGNIFVVYIPDLPEVKKLLEHVFPYLVAKREAVKWTIECANSGVFS